MGVQTRVQRLAGSGMLGIGAIGVVAHAADLPAGAVPDLMQVLQAGAEHRFGVAPDLDPAGLGARCRVGRPGLADHVAVFAQAVFAQELHDLRALGRANLQHHAQFLVEEGLQRQLLAPRADLGCPVLAVAVIGAAVADAIALGDQQIDIERHAHMPGKRHLAHRGEQAAVAAVVIGQDQRPLAQGVHGAHQAHQILRLLEVRHGVAELIERLRQNAAAHAHAPTTEVDQHQAAVLRGIELRRQRMAHVGQRGEGGDDQGYR